MKDCKGTPCIEDSEQVWRIYWLVQKVQCTTLIALLKTPQPEEIDTLMIDFTCFFDNFTLVYRYCVRFSIIHCITDNAKNKNLQLNLNH